MGDTDARKIVFVTGAASGIGRAAAEAFVRRGYATALADVNEEAGAKVEAELRALGECTFVACDVTDDDTVRDAVAAAVATYGRLDAAFNAAGIDGEHGKPTAECTMENWNRVIAVDLTGTFSCMRYELPAIVDAGGGSIVNCASVAGLRGAPSVPAYTAAKHGVVGLTRAAAREYAVHGGARERHLSRDSRHPDVPHLDGARGDRAPRRHQPDRAAGRGERDRRGRGVAVRGRAGLPHRPGHRGRRWRRRLTRPSS